MKKKMQETSALRRKRDVTLQMKLKNMMMIGKDRTVFRYFEQSKLQSKYIRQTVLLKLLCHHQTSRMDKQQAWYAIDNPVVMFLI